MGRRAIRRGESGARGRAASGDGRRTTRRFLATARRVVIAAAGAATRWEATDHAAVGRDARYRREGFQYW
ncbi:MAG TPA: hypothetical protein VFJ74_12175 [Gemmatimonadaceae bacterium]|nr:hypothetical protein [Gemmatimonadaceae bacterium]